MYDEHGSNENPYKLTSDQSRMIGYIGGGLLIFGTPLLLLGLFMLSK